MVGVCGGFTTFSTFSKEVLIMIQSSNNFGVMTYIAISIVAGITLAAAGYYITR